MIQPAFSRPNFAATTFLQRCSFATLNHQSHFRRKALLINKRDLMAKLPFQKGRLTAFRFTKLNLWASSISSNEDSFWMASNLLATEQGWEIENEINRKIGNSAFNKTKSPYFGEGKIFPTRQSLNKNRLLDMLVLGTRAKKWDPKPISYGLAKFQLFHTMMSSLSNGKLQNQFFLGRYWITKTHNVCFPLGSYTQMFWWIRFGSKKINTIWSKPFLGKNCSFFFFLFSRYSYGE